MTRRIANVFVESAPSFGWMYFGVNGGFVHQFSGDGPEGGGRTESPSRPCLTIAIAPPVRSSRHVLHDQPGSSINEIGLLLTSAQRQQPTLEVALVANRGRCASITPPSLVISSNTLSSKSLPAFSLSARRCRSRGARLSRARASHAWDPRARSPIDRPSAAPTGWIPLAFRDEQRV